MYTFTMVMPAGLPIVRFVNSFMNAWASGKQDALGTIFPGDKRLDPFLDRSLDLIVTQQPGQFVNYCHRGCNGLTASLASGSGLETPICQLVSSFSFIIARR
jgi:hypothetical protein